MEGEGAGGGGGGGGGGGPIGAAVKAGLVAPWEAVVGGFVLTVLFIAGFFLLKVRRLHTAERERERGREA